MAEADLGAGGGLSTPLETNKHDDIRLSLGGVPDRHARIQQLAELVEHRGLDDPPLAETCPHVLKVYG